MAARNLPAGPKSWLLIGLGVGVGIVLALVLMRGRGATPPQPVAPAVESPAEMVLTGVEFTEIEHEQQKWTLRASQARYFQNEQKTELKDVHLVLHTKSGDEVELQSQSGILYAGTKALELIGGVQARIARSFLLTTDYAFYDHERQRISSGAGVHVEGPELLLDGAAWEYMIVEQRGRVDGGVKAKLDIYATPDLPVIIFKLSPYALALVGNRRASGWGESMCAFFAVGGHGTNDRWDWQTGFGMVTRR